MHCGANTKVVIPSFSVTMALWKRKKLNKKLQKGLTLKQWRCGTKNYFDKITKRAHSHFQTCENIETGKMWKI